MFWSIAYIINVSTYTLLTAKEFEHRLRGLTRYLATRAARAHAFRTSISLFSDARFQASSLLSQRREFQQKKQIPLLYSEDLHDALGSALHNKSRAQDLPTGLECGHVQKMKKTIASIKFSVNPGSNERIVTKLRITL